MWTWITCYGWERKDELTKTLSKVLLFLIQVKWLLSPIILTFVILPMVLLTLIYVSSLSLYNAHLSGTQEEADKVGGAFFDLKFILCLQEGWRVGRAGWDLFWPFLVSWQVSARDHVRQDSWSLMKKSHIFKSCILKGRLWQHCGMHMLGIDMAMSWEVWNTCPPRLPIVYYPGAIPVE